MKAIRTFLFVLLTIPLLSAWAGALAPQEIQSNTAILMDAETGQVLFNKNMHTQMYPASMTKIMTGLLVCENSSMDEVVTVSESAVDIGVAGSAHIALSPGEQLSVDSALYALMLPSANDAANALAEHVAGSQKKFVAMMNQKAQEIGAVHTKFANPSGLHDAQHYSTAYDMALITRYAWKNPTFMRYFGTATHTMPATNVQPLERPFTNYQYMLVPNTRYYNESVIGGKVGYTLEAQHTMSTVATQNGRTLVCVVMHSSSRYDKFKDTQKLLDFGFNEFRPVTIAKEEFAGFSVPVEQAGTVVGTVDFSAENDFTALLHESVRAAEVQAVFDCPEKLQVDAEIPNTVTFRAPASGGAPPELGTVELVTHVVATAGAPVFPAVPQEPPEPAAAFAFSRSVKIFVLGALLVVLFSLVVVLVLRQHALQKRRRKRLARLRQHVRG